MECTPLQDPTLSPRSLLQARMEMGRPIVLPIEGTSMGRTLRAGDQVQIQALELTQLRMGDLIAFWSGKRVVVHRFLGFQQREGETWVLEKGDALRLGRAFPSGDWIGKVVAHRRGADWQSLENPRVRGHHRMCGLAHRMRWKVFQALKTLVKKKELSPENQALVLASRLDLNSEQVDFLKQLLARLPDPTAFLQKAQRLGVASLLNHHTEIIELPFPEEIKEALKACTLRESLRHLRREADLRRILEAMNTQGIPVILLKGALTARWIYPDPALRPMTDLDLLLQPCHRDLALKILDELGLQEKPLEEGLVQGRVREELGERTGHLAPRYTSSTRVEIHLCLFGAQSPDPEALQERIWAQSELFTWEGGQARCLSPHHLVLHLASHLAKHLPDSALNLYWLMDLHEVLLRLSPTLDWAILQREAQELGLDFELRQALSLIARFWGSPVPQDFVIRKLPELEPALEALSADERNRSAWKGGALQTFRSGWRTLTLGDFLTMLLRAAFPKTEILRSRYQAQTPIRLLFWRLAHPLFRSWMLFLGCLHHVRQRLSP